MPTNLKTLLSRSRSRTELKVREEKGVEDCSYCRSSIENTGGGNGAGTPEHPPAPVSPSLHCQCHWTGEGSSGVRRMRRDVSSRSLFSLPGDEPSLAPDSRPVSPAGISSKLSSNSLAVPMRKCETVLALSTFTNTNAPGVAGAPSTPAGPSATGRVRLMKDKILSTSSSALNSIIHSSNKTTSKLFSGWKLSSSSNSSQSNSCVNSGLPTTPKLLPEMMGLGGDDGSKSRSQTSILETGVAPLTPTNRLRRNGSMTNARLNPAFSRYSSVSSMVLQEEQEVLCRLCLCSVKMEDTVEIQACSCRYCKDCLTAYVSFEVQEAAYDIACPDATCEKQGVMSLVEIEALVPIQLIEKHKKFRLHNDVEKDCQLMWCPSPGCETICKIQESDLNGLKPGTPVIQCARCQHVYCTVCKLPAHHEVSCEIYKQKLIRQGKLSLVDEEPFASYDSIKKCPFCHVPIEKDSGCAQMMCKRCKHVFCWYCLASLDDDFLLRHYDKGPCKNKLGHSRASVVWHRAQVIGIFAGFGLLVLLASPLLILAAPCLLCCKCRYCANQLDPDESPASI